MTDKIKKDEQQQTDRKKHRTQVRTKETQNTERKK